MHRFVVAAAVAALILAGAALALAWHADRRPAAAVTLGDDASVSLAGEAGLDARRELAEHEARLTRLEQQVR